MSYLRTIANLLIILGLNLPAQAKLLPNEANTIKVFNNSVRSVVNVTSSRRVTRGTFLFDFDVTEIPAGTGSGFVWDKDGHIVTNFHVVEGGSSFLISFHKDKKQYRAKVVGIEPKKDLAVLKLLERPKNLYPITPGDSSALRVGQKALAIGNPFGLDNTLTVGVISALGRKIPSIVRGVKIHGMIQTDCSINPGNSGGPLLDSSGKTIGINALIYSKSGSSAGVSFAVPINTAKRLVPKLIKHGKIKRPSLGIEILEDHYKDYFGIRKGVVIKSIAKGSPAHKSGFEGMSYDRYGRYYLGDIILEVEGKKVNSFDDIYHALDNKKVGDKVVIKYKRKNKILKTSIKLQKL